MKKTLTALFMTICILISLSGFSQKDKDKSKPEVIMTDSTVFISIRDLRPFMAALENEIKSSDGSSLKLSTSEHRIIATVLNQMIGATLENWKKKNNIK